MGNSPAQCKENCGQDSNARNLEHRLGGGGGGGSIRLVVGLLMVG